jgi:transmembrane sensor
MGSDANDDIAASWLVKRESGVWTEKEEQELNTWLDVSLTHRIAYLRLQSSWVNVARMKALGANVPQGTVPSRGLWNSTGVLRGIPPDAPPGVRLQAVGDSEYVPGARDVSNRHLNPIFSGKRKWIVGALAASFAVVAIGISIMNAGLWPGHRYSTQTGAIDTVALKDGSHIILNSDSQIRVDLGEGERRISLTQGEAFFEVAKDASRPFIVRVGQRRVIAVGTQFSVRREGDDMRVVVTEGKVRIEQLSPVAGAAEHQGPLHVVLVAAGNVAQTAKGDVMIRAESEREAENLLSWRQGYVNFDHVSLADAVAEFNRYNTRKVIIQDPTISTILISGNFRANNTDAFLDLLQSGFPVSVEKGSDQITLSARFK